MKNPDFPKIAEGYGIKSNKVENKSKLKKSIKELLDYKNAYLLEVVVEKEENVFPMVASGDSVSNIRLE